MVARSVQKIMFSPVINDEDSAFDEGPPAPRTKNTSENVSVLSSSYAFLQGVELTRQEQYTSGLFKIWSGDVQHRLRPVVFGQERMSFSATGFVDADRCFAQGLVNDRLHPSFIVDDPIESRDYNGVIEPLTIRRVVVLALRPDEEAHSVTATLLAGNIESDGSSSEVLTVDSINTISCLPFFDTTMGHKKANMPAASMPFSDVRSTVSSVVPQASDLLAALSVMTGSSSDGYVGHDQRSASCGWYHDNSTSPGTDSLAFSGMKY